MQIFERFGAQQLQIDDGKREHNECMGRHDAHESEIKGLKEAFGRFAHPGMGS